MSLSFHVGPLSGEQVPLAFPLIQATWPGADLASWLSFVEFFNDHLATMGSGVLALRDQGGYICGVLVYRRDRDLRAGPILAVELLTAVDLVDSPRTVQALLDAAETRALELGCAGVQIRLHKDQAGLASRLRSLALVSEAGLFWKKIDPVQARS